MIVSVDISSCHVPSRNMYVFTRCYHTRPNHATAILDLCVEIILRSLLTRLQCYNTMGAPTQSVSGGPPLSEIVALVVSEGYVMDWCNQYFQSCHCVMPAQPQPSSCVATTTSPASAVTKTTTTTISIGMCYEIIGGGVPAVQVLMQCHLPTMLISLTRRVFF